MAVAIVFIALYFLGYIKYDVNIASNIHRLKKNFSLMDVHGNKPRAAFASATVLIAIA